MGRLSAKSKAKLLEAFLTAQNENAKALADIASGIGALRFATMKLRYADITLNIVGSLETEGGHEMDTEKVNPKWDKNGNKAATK